jgi:capsular polysaccharide transport system ATP-binding protein
VIFLEHIHKSYGRGPRAKKVLKNASFVIEGSSKSAGILGAKKSGKTTIVNIISGIAVPDSGRVVRKARVSWPLSWRGFGGQMTGEEFISIIARMYRFGRWGLLRFTAEASDLRSKLYEPMQAYTAEEKDRLMQAAAIGLDFEVYLIDEHVPEVGKQHQPRYHFLWEETFRKSRVVAVSAKPAVLSRYCQSAHVLSEGRISEALPLEQAESALEATTQKQGAPL